MNCNLKFHVECARINKYQLELATNNEGEVRDYNNIIYLNLVKILCILSNPSAS